MAQRLRQVVRGHVGELLQLGVGALQLGGALAQLRHGLPPALRRPACAPGTGRPGRRSWSSLPPGPSSGGSTSGAKNSITPITSSAWTTGSPTPACRPAAAAASGRAKWGSRAASAIHTGAPSSHTRPGSPTPRPGAAPGWRARTRQRQLGRPGRRRSRSLGSAARRPPARAARSPRTAHPRLLPTACSRRVSARRGRGCRPDHLGHRQLGAHVALRLPALGDVAQDAGEGGLPACSHMPSESSTSISLPSRRSAVQLDAGAADQPGLPGGQQASEPVEMGRAIALGHDRRQLQPHRLLGAVAQQRLGRGVPEHDPPVPVGGHDRVVDRLRHRAQVVLSAVARPGAGPGSLSQGHGRWPARRRPPAARAGRRSAPAAWSRASAGRPR